MDRGRTGKYEGMNGEEDGGRRNHDLTGKNHFISVSFICLYFTYFKYPNNHGFYLGCFSVAQ